MGLNKDFLDHIYQDRAALHRFRKRVSARESVSFIGTQFSNLYTAVDTPARGRVWCVCGVCAWCLRVSMCSDVLGSLSLRTRLSRSVFVWRGHTLPGQPPPMRNSQRCCSLSTLRIRLTMCELRSLGVLKHYLS